MNDTQMKDALEQIARQSVPESINLWPRIATQLDERKSLLMKFRTRPFVALLIALLFLVALSGVAYALGRAFGYFPGLGLVEQDAQFHVLSEPVSQTREGITVTIMQAISNADQMSVTLKVENVPTEKQTFQNMSEPDMCRSYPDSYPQMGFPNGEAVKISSGVIDPLIGGYQAQYKFSSVTMNAAEVILFIPCIHGAVSPGILPENWEVSVRFVSAPAELALTMIPVMIVPTMQATPEPALVTPTGLPPEPASEKTDRLSVMKVIDTGKDYIIIGTFTRPAPRPNEKGIYALVDIILHDSNQQVIEDEEFPFDLDLTPYILETPAEKSVWAVKLTKEFTPPLHLTYQTQYYYSPLPQDSYTFDFDAGPNPQVNQEWNVDREFQLAGHAVTLTKITAGTNNYAFFFHTDDETVESVGMYSRDDIQITGYTPTDFRGYFGIGDWNLTKVYSELPTGNLQVVLSGIYLFGNIEDWTMIWQP